MATLLYDSRNYRAYLRSDAWSALCFTKKRFANWICEEPGCSAPSVEIHHISYERLGYEWLEDLVAVCRYHHELRHIEEWAERARRGWQTRRGRILPMAVQRELPLIWEGSESDRKAA